MRRKDARRRIAAILNISCTGILTIREDARFSLMEKRVAQTGSSSSISDEKNNIHWFVATTETAFTFDVIMLDLNGEKHDIHNLDIRSGEKISNGLIRAKKIDVATALKKYGKEAFH